MKAGASSTSGIGPQGRQELPHTLSDRCALAIIEFAGAHPTHLRNPAHLTHLPESELALQELRELALMTRSELRDGVGYSWVRLGSLPKAYGRLAFGMIGMLIAPPIDRYGFHYAVQDTGESYTEKAIPVSKTRASTGLHTDSSAHDCLPGTVALYCERPSLDGGISCLANAHAACSWIRKHRPEAFQELQRSFVRKIVTPGLDKSLESLKKNRFPIVQWEPTFVFRYMRYWIEEGQRELGQPLSPITVAALDVLDQALVMPEHRTSLRLESGDMLFVNNTHMAHGRTAYKEVPDGGRLLWRMWLDERAALGASQPKNVPNAKSS